MRKDDIIKMGGRGRGGRGRGAGPRGGRGGRGGQGRGRVCTDVTYYRVC